MDLGLPIMNFLQTSESINDMSIFQTLLLFQCFELFTKSYQQQLSRGTIFNAPISIQVRLATLSEWWAGRKQRIEKDFAGDQLMLKELVALREFL